MPAIVDCPICSASSKFEMRHVNLITCRACGFVGDILKLIAIKSKEDIEVTAKSLLAKGLVDFGKEGVDRYIANSKVQSAIQELIKKKVEAVRTGVSGSILAVFSEIGARFTPQDIAKLAPHAIPMRRMELPEGLIGKDGREALKWWGNYDAMAIPTYNAANVTGFWLLTRNGHNYLPITGEPGAGFGLAPSLSSKFCCVVDDPIQAIRLNIWSIVESREMGTYVAPVGLVDTTEHYRTKEVIFWSPTGSLTWLARALQQPAVKAIPSNTIKYDLEHGFPAGGNYPEAVASIFCEAVSPHRAFAETLLAIPDARAREQLHDVALDASDRSKCIACVSGDDSKRITQLLSETTTVQTVTWNGQIITESSDGWVCKGKCISSAMMYMDEVRPHGKTGEATLSGHVIYQQKSYAFRELFSIVRKNAGAWLQNFIVAQCGHIPYVEKNWTHRLLEISQQFKMPTPIMSGQRYGWDSTILRMPFFTVDLTGVCPSISTLEGPRVSPPSTLSDAERDTFKREGFCRLFLTIIGSMLSTQKQVRGHGIMVINEPSAVARYASSMGMNVVHDPTAEQLSLAGLDPLPLPVTYSDRSAQLVLGGQESKHVFVSVDNHTARLARLTGDWLTMGVGDQVDANSTAFVFHILPKLIDKKLDPASPTFYRDIAKVAMANDQLDKMQTKLHSAAIDMDMLARRNKDNFASRVLEYLVAHVDRELLSTVSETMFSVLLSKDSVAEAMSHPHMKVPSITVMEKALIEAGFVVENTRLNWGFARNVWDFYVSSVKTKV